MSFSSTPITAAGSAADYTHQFKKHFGDRPTAFAHSARSGPHSSASSSTHPSYHHPSLDPSAASSTSSTSTTSTTSTATCNSQPHSTLIKSDEVRGALVDSETQNALANLGWRIRSRVNQGYSRASTSVDALHRGDGFVSERDVLRNVTNSRRGWSRVSTAPWLASNFDELRCGQTCQQSDDEMGSIVDGSKTIDVVDKRTRRLSESDEEEEQVRKPQVPPSERRIAGLPKLSFCSSVSSSSSHDGSFFSHSASRPNLLSLPATQTSARAFARSPSSSHSPFNIPPSSETTLVPLPHNYNMHTDVAMDMVDESIAKDHDADAMAYDFSSHFNSTDF